MMVKSQMNAMTFRYFRLLMDRAKDIILVISMADRVPRTVTPMVTP